MNTKQYAFIYSPSSEWIIPAFRVERGLGSFRLGQLRLFGMMPRTATRRGEEDRKRDYAVRHVGSECSDHASRRPDTVSQPYGVTRCVLGLYCLCIESRA